MFFPGTPNIFVPGDSVFMLFKCMCHNISIEKKKTSATANVETINETASAKSKSFD